VRVRVRVRVKVRVRVRVRVVRVRVRLRVSGQGRVGVMVRARAREVTVFADAAILAHRAPVVHGPALVRAEEPPEPDHFAGTQEAVADV